MMKNNEKIISKEIRKNHYSIDRPEKPEPTYKLTPSEGVMGHHYSQRL